MFEETLKWARKMNGEHMMPVAVYADDEGYFDRRCPSTECGADFKVHFDDWTEKVTEERAYCPVCRCQAAATEWNTLEQDEYLADFVMAELAKQLDEVLERDARAFNAGNRIAGFVTLSLHYKPGPEIVVVPPNVADIMRQKFTCEVCGCRYASVGAAFFCPACGHNSALSSFSLSVASIRDALSHLDTIRKAITDRDEAERILRLFIEQSLDKLVASFQRFAEEAFLSLPNSGEFKLRKNLFQNLAESSDKWKLATGHGYEDLLSEDKLREIGVFFQQRHVLVHNDGIVDDEYIRKSGDTAYQVGQRLVIKPDTVMHFSELIEQLTIKLSEVAGQLSVQPIESDTEPNNE